MSHSVVELRNISKSYSDYTALTHINLTAKRGEFLTLLGPSGCGKTTILRLISGFETPDSGEICIEGANAAGIPPNQRNVHTVFQNYALFPHMSVFENIAFGLKCQKLPMSEVKQRVAEVLQMIKLEHLQNRKATELSGGQQQRVAIARAIVNKPSVLLLDEPLSSLDYRLRKRMQIELKQLQKKLKITFIFVTHDQEEALSMSDRIIVMDDGNIEQVGTPREIYENPVNLTVAKFIGEVNIFDGEILNANLKKMQIKIDDRTYEVNHSNQYNVGDKVHVTVRPEDVRVWHKGTHVDQGTTIPAIVETVTYKGSTVDIVARLKNNRLIKTTQFFDEDDESLLYDINEPVILYWTPGWEVVLPYEN